MVKKDIDFWLNESDLKTPIHDEMVLWTFNNAGTIIKDLKLDPEIITSFRESSSYFNFNFEEGICYPTESGKNRYSSLEELNKKLQEINKSYEKQKDEVKANLKIERIIEFPIKSYNGFNLGYLDLLVKMSFKAIHTNSFYTRFNPTKYNSREIDEGVLVAFEIKPKVSSIGEVLRQFQYYKSNLPIGTKLILVTTTTGLKEIFNSQGFEVIEYKKEGEDVNGRTNN